MSADECGPSPKRQRTLKSDGVVATRSKSERSGTGRRRQLISTKLKQLRSLAQHHANAKALRALSGGLLLSLHQAVAYSLVRLHLSSFQLRVTKTKAATVFSCSCCGKRVDNLHIALHQCRVRSRGQKGSRPWKPHWSWDEMCDAGLVVTKEAVQEGKARAAAAAEAQRQVAAAEAVQQLQDAQAAAAAAMEQAAARPTRAGRARVAEAAAAVAAAEQQLARATMGRAKGSGKRGRQQQSGAQGAVGGAPSAQQALRAAALVDPLTANSGLCLLCNGPVGRKKGHSCAAPYLTTFLCDLSDLPEAGVDDGLAGEELCSRYRQLDLACITLLRAAKQPEAGGEAGKETEAAGATPVLMQTSEHQFVTRRFFLGDAGSKGRGVFALEAMGEEGAGDTRGEGGVAASSGTAGGSLVKDTDDPRLFSYIGVLTRADRVDHDELSTVLEGGHRVSDPREQGSVGVLCNHACGDRANCELAYMVDPQRGRKVQVICMRAGCKLCPGDELTWDYGATTQCWAELNNTPCLCGATPAHSLYKPAAAGMQTACGACSSCRRLREEGQEADRLLRLQC